MLSINSNVSASLATYAMRQANAGEIKAGERLSSGYRVNSAADDAAGNTVVTKLTKDIQGVKTAIRNSADMHSALSVVDNSYAILDSMLIRMRELAIQSASGSDESAERTVQTHPDPSPRAGQRSAALQARSPRVRPGH